MTNISVIQSCNYTRVINLFFFSVVSLETACSKAHNEHSPIHPFLLSQYRITIRLRSGAKDSDLCFVAMPFVPSVVCLGTAAVRQPSRNIVERNSFHRPTDVNTSSPIGCPIFQPNTPKCRVWCGQKLPGRLR